MGRPLAHGQVGDVAAPGGPSRSFTRTAVDADRYRGTSNGCGSGCRHPERGGLHYCDLQNMVEQAMPSRTTKRQA